MKFKGRKLSISKRITLIYSFILFSILMIFTILTFAGISYISIKDSENELISNTNTISSYIEGFKNDQNLEFKNLSLNYSIIYSVYDANKMLLYTNKSDLPHLKFSPENKILLFHGERSEIDITYTNKKIYINNKIYYLQVAKSENVYKGDLHSLGRSLFFAIILGVIACVLSGKKLSKIILKPIRNISNTMKEITSKSLNSRIPLDGPDDELRELAIIFNSMIGRLESDFEKQKRFISDASHELRTPLSIIDLQVNMLSRWGKNDPKILEKSLNDLKEETISMNKLIGNLLYLANSDRNTLVLKMEKFPLHALINDVIDETLLIDSNYLIHYTCDNDHLLNADYSAIKQVLRILVDNSMKFSAPPGNIVIKAEAKPEGTVISVEDKGCGIPSVSLPYIFDRFYRVDESRTKATGGTGLGLAIAKQIVQNHKGTISVTSKASEGTKFEIYLPVL